MIKGRRWKEAFGLVAILMAASACATTRSEGAGTRSDVITRDEIVAEAGVRNLYELVQRLRPRWITARNQDRSFGMTTEIAVYQNQTYLGDVETLRQVGPTMAYELRWIEGQTAMSTLTGFGSGKHLAGAIIIGTAPPGSN
ncbi:MAG TPA: hypothetical protein VLH75_16230 [Longimicrobiales bacterium]|nr:hypothetical protein [Longimicrobiales bacterium]